MRASAYLKGNYADRFPFGGEGVFLKGNLHTHTTVTDGPLDPEETIRRYKAAGYDFLSLTDHFIYTALPDQGGLTLLPGVTGAEINPRIGTVLVLYAPSLTSSRAIRR